MIHQPTYSRNGDIMQLWPYWLLRPCGNEIDQSERRSHSVGPPRSRHYKSGVNGFSLIHIRLASLLTGRAERRLNYLINLFLQLVQQNSIQNGEYTFLFLVQY